MCGDTNSLATVVHHMRQDDKPSAYDKRQKYEIRACTQATGGGTSDRMRRHNGPSSFEHKHEDVTGTLADSGRSIAELMKQPRSPPKEESVKQPSKTPATNHASVAHGTRQTPPHGCSRARDEVFAEIKQLLEGNPALQLVDFDYRVRQHLHAILGAGGQERLHSALVTIHNATATKTRRDVKNWPAYIGKLLSKFSDEISQKNRNMHVQALVAQAVPPSLPNDKSKAASKEAASEEHSDEEAWIEALAKSKAGPKEAASSEQSEEEAWIEALDKELSDEDQWLNDLAKKDESEQSSPRKESRASPTLSQQRPEGPQKPFACMPPLSLPPQEPPRIQMLPQQECCMQGAPRQPPVLPHTTPMPPPPAHPPVLPFASSKNLQAQPPMVPPTQPPCSQPPKAPLTQPPMGPPKLNSKILLETSPVQPPSKPPSLQPQAHHETQLLSEKQQSLPVRMPEMWAHGEKAPDVLDFPLESWAAWLRFPPQPATCH